MRTIGRTEFPCFLYIVYDESIIMYTLRETGNTIAGNMKQYKDNIRKCMIMKRGDIYYADLRPVIGSEQGGIRPVLIIQNDIGNKHSPTVICAAITSKMNKAKLPTHIELNASKYDMVKDSVILLEQLRTIDKKRLKDRICHLDQDIMQVVNNGLMVSLELNT